MANIGQSSIQFHLSESHELRTMLPCQFCNAKRFEYEPPTFRCHNGEISLTSPDSPEGLQELFTSPSAEALEVCSHIRACNSIFAFTSFSVKIDKNLATSSKGAYIFRAQGQIYHDLPSFIPSSNASCYFQL